MVACGVIINGRRADGENKENVRKWGKFLFRLKVS